SELGIYDLGLFASLAALTATISTLVTALSQSMSVRFAKYHATANRDAFKSLLLKAVRVVTVLGIAGVVTSWMFGEPVVRAILGNEYASHVSVLIWLMIATATW